MNTELKEKCDLLIQNRNTITNIFKMSSANLSLASAALFTSKGVAADEELLKKCEAVFKNKTSAFSEYRGNVKVPLICKMALSDDPEAYFDKVEAVYRSLHKSKLFGSEYKIMAAITICDNVDESDYDTIADRTNEIYSKMKKKHQILTSGEDIPFAALLAASGADADQMIDETELNYKLLKKKFSEANAVQTLSHVLALNDQPAEEKCAKVEAIFNELKEIKHKFGSGFELSFLGTLISLDIQPRELAELIAETDDYLKEQKGFSGAFSSHSSSERRMYAAQLVLNHLSSVDTSTDSVIFGSALAIAILIEMLIAVCILSTINNSAANMN